MKGIDSRVAVVSGGGGGIGSAIVARLAHEGAQLVVADHDGERARAAAEQVVSSGGQAIPSVTDVTDATAVAALFDLAEQRFGRPRILVNCVGISEGLDVFRTSAEDWDRTLGVNLKSYFLCSREFAMRLHAAGEPGAVVNISSTNAFFAEPEAIAYTSSKGGIESLTKGLAIELAASRVRVNAVAPGMVRTPITDLMLAEADDAEAMLANWNSAGLMGRIADPSEVAAVVVFLASDEASFVTGASWVVDGGLTCGWAF